MATRVYVLGGAQQGEPSQIVGEVAVDRVIDAGEQFELTPEFLDAKKEVMRLLEQLNERGVTLIVVTHDSALGARARRQLLMEDGALKHDAAVLERA